MAKQRVSIQRRGVRVMELFDVELTLDDEGREQLARDPSGFLKRELEAQGHQVREVRIDASSEAMQSAKGGSTAARMSMVHIVYDIDPIAICMWSDRF